MTMNQTFYIVYTVFVSSPHYSYGIEESRTIVIYQLDAFWFREHAIPRYSNYGGNEITSHMKIIIFAILINLRIG